MVITCTKRAVISNHVHSATSSKLNSASKINKSVTTCNMAFQLHNMEASELVLLELNRAKRVTLFTCHTGQLNEVLICQGLHLIKHTSSKLYSVKTYNFMLLFVHHHVVPINTMNKGLYVKEIIVNAAKAGKQNSHMIWATNKI